MERPVTLSRHYVLAAGGTGGHMIPAHALAEELMRRGHRVALVTDDRGARIPGLFHGVQVHILPAGRLGGGPAGWFKAVRNILTGRAMASRLYETFKPSAVIGFGGYPALPALLGWVVTAYSLVYAVAIPFFGRLADIFGARRFFVAGQAVIFAVGASGWQRSMVSIVCSGFSVQNPASFSTCSAAV